MTCLLRPNLPFTIFDGYAVYLHVGISTNIRKYVYTKLNKDVSVHEHAAQY